MTPRQFVINFFALLSLTCFTLAGLALLLYVVGETLEHFTP